MTSPTCTQEGLTLQEFLEMPGIDESPSLEFLDGKVVRKVSPQMKQSLLTGCFVEALNAVARPARLGFAFPELRCTYAGRSVVPDVAFLLNEHIEFDEHGEVTDETPIPPDLHIEILCPDEGSERADEKLRHSTSHGGSIGWLVHLYRRSIRVYRPGQAPIDLPPDGVLEAEPVLPGFRLTVAEVFGWLTRRSPRRSGAGGESA